MVKNIKSDLGEKSRKISVKDSKNYYMCFKGTELLPRGCSEETSRKFMELIFYEEIGQRGDLLK